MAEIYSTWDGTYQGTTSIIDQEPEEWLVKYPKGDGTYFRVIVRKKPNPIGFIWRWKK